MRVCVGLSYTNRVALYHSTCVLRGSEGRVLCFKVNEKRSPFQVKLSCFSLKPRDVTIHWTIDVLQ